MRGSTLLISMLLLLLLFGCDSHDSIEGARVELNSLDPDIQKIHQVLNSYNNGKYVRLIVEAGNPDSTKEVFINTEEEQIEQEFMELLPENRYEIEVVQNKLIRIFDHIHKEIILERDLLQEDSFSTVENLRFSWSNTGRYLSIKQRSSGNKLLLDVTKNKVVHISLENWSRIEWSEDDTRAVVSIEREDRKLQFDYYLWNVDTGAMYDLGEGNVLLYKWSPDNYLYAIDLFNEETANDYDDHDKYAVLRFSETDGSWIVVYKTVMNMYSQSFKPISKDEFIFTAYSVEKTKNKLKAMLEPDDFVVKFNVITGEETIKKLDAALPKDFFWSFDNNYVYYQDVEGFYRAEVGF